MLRSVLGKLKGKYQDRAQRAGRKELFLVDTFAAC